MSWSCILGISYRVLNDGKVELRAIVLERGDLNDGTSGPGMVGIQSLGCGGHKKLGKLSGLWGWSSAIVRA